jgi:hypothetical protein
MGVLASRPGFEARYGESVRRKEHGMSTPHKRFRQFYGHYLTLHQNRVCRRLHLAGTLLAVGFFVWLLFTPYWMWAWCAPLAAYPFAWLGHFLFEKNRPASFSNPVFSFAADLKMAADIIRGRIQF